MKNQFYKYKSWSIKFLKRNQKVFPLLGWYFVEFFSQTRFIRRSTILCCISGQYIKLSLLLIKQIILRCYKWFFLWLTGIKMTLFHFH